MTPLDLLGRLQNINVDRAAKMTLGETREIFLDLNREQLMSGIRADKSKITPEYAHFTRQKKQEQGRDPDVVTLYDTGDFYRAMFLDVGSDLLEVDSTDYKSEELQEKYGEKIFGLTDDSKITYTDEIFPVFLQKIEDILNGK